jgi:hypothetical protein
MARNCSGRRAACEEFGLQPTRLPLQLYDAVAQEFVFSGE